MLSVIFSILTNLMCDKIKFQISKRVYYKYSTRIVILNMQNLLRKDKYNFINFRVCGIDFERSTYMEMNYLYLSVDLIKFSLEGRDDCQRTVVAFVNSNILL